VYLTSGRLIWGDGIGARAEVVGGFFQPTLRAGAACGLQMFKKGALGVELARDTESFHPLLIADDLDAHVLVARGKWLLERPLLQQALHEGDCAHLVHR
jgi:hypothetical protein